MNTSAASIAHNLVHVLQSHSGDFLLFSRGRTIVRVSEKGSQDIVESIYFTGGPSHDHEARLATLINRNVDGDNGALAFIYQLLMEHPNLKKELTMSLLEDLVKGNPLEASEVVCNLIGRDGTTRSG